MTAYRNDDDALRTRLAEVERELDSAKAHIARLEGRLETEPRAADWLIGAPIRERYRIELDGTLDADGLAQIVRVIEGRMGLRPLVKGGVVTAHAEGLAAALGPRAFSLESGETKTTARLDSDLDRLPVVVALGPVLGALVSVPYVLWQMTLFHHFEPGETLASILATVTTLSVLGAIATRWLAKRHAKRVHAGDAGVWATVLEVTRQRVRTRVRVATPADRALEEAPESEGSAEAEDDTSAASAAVSPGAVEPRRA